MKTTNNTLKIVLTALMIGLILVAIMFIRIPIPFTQGYVHIGDAMVFLAVMILGWKYGALSAALGGMLGDLLCGFAMWAPWTFAIKGIMALILGLVMSTASKGAVGRKGFLVRELIGMLLAGSFMVAGYFAAEGIMYGNWAVAALGIPWNVGQLVVGMALALILAEAICKTSINKHFAYSVRRKSMTEKSM